MIKKTIFLLLSVQLLFATAEQSSCNERYFDLSITSSQGVSLYDLIDNLANECKLSVVFEDGGVKEQLNKTVSYINASNFTLEELFELIFNENNIYYEYAPQKKVLKLAYIKTKSYDIDYVNFAFRKSESTKSINIGVNKSSNDDSSNNDSSNNSDKTTISTSNDFEFWKNFETEVQNILVQDSFEAAIQTKTVLNKDAGTLTVSATKKQLDRVESYINKVMGRLHKQIMIEAKIVEVTTSDIHSRGIDWSQIFQATSGSVQGNVNMSNSATTTSSFALNYGASIDTIMEYLDTYGDVEVVSNPKILTLNNQPAIINVGQQLNYRYESGEFSASESGGVFANEYETDSLFVGVSLSVVPEVTQDGFVMLTVQPVISSLVSDNVNEGNDERILPPDTKIKQMSSIVKVKEGSKVVIGGLIENENSTQRVGLPLLKDMPLLGIVFGKDSKRTVKKELVVILTPTFVGGDTKPTIENFEKLFLDE
jgi:general secretion pathway protein D